MGFLKGIGTVVCSVLFFVALVVFSVAFLLDSTVLSADFVKSQVDKVDISSIIDTTIEEQISQEIPPDAEFLKGVALEIIDIQEPLIKEQIHIAIDESYTFILEENSELTISISLVEIKQSLKDTLWQAAVDYLKKQLAGLSDEEVDMYVEDIMRQIPEELLPPELAILPEDVRNDVIKQYLKELGGRGIFESFSFSLDFIVEDQVKVYFEGYFEDFVEEIPDAYTIDESSISPETMDTFREARRYISYFQAAYIWLIVFMIVMAGLIFLINWRNVKASVRVLGIDLLIFGVLSLAGVLVVRSLNILQLVDVPVSMQNVAESIFQDATGIALMFSIGVLVVGVILLAASFFIKPPEAVD